MSFAENKIGVAKQSDGLEQEVLRNKQAQSDRNLGRGNTGCGNRQPVYAKAGAKKVVYEKEIDLESWGGDRFEDNDLDFCA